MSMHAVELLISRLCHDLVGPVGAINNGVELVEETGLAGGDDALDLIADSAEVAARRLKMFRLAFGAAGGRDDLPPADVRAVLEGWFRGGKVRLAWAGDLPPAAPRGLYKLTLAAALLAEEAMPQGGVLTIGPDGGGIRLEAAGVNAGLREEVRFALEGTAAENELSPRAILAFAILRSAHHYGCGVSAPPAGPNAVLLRLSGPSVA